MALCQRRTIRCTEDLMKWNVAALWQSGAGYRWDMNVTPECAGPYNWRGPCVKKTFIRVTLQTAWKCWWHVLLLWVQAEMNFFFFLIRSTVLFLCTHTHTFIQYMLLPIILVKTWKWPELNDKSEKIYVRELRGGGWEQGTCMSLWEHKVTYYGRSSRITWGLARCQSQDQHLIWCMFWPGPAALLKGVTFT